jgi:hypothetical protein
LLREDRASAAEWSSLSVVQVRSALGWGRRARKAREGVQQLLKSVVRPVALGERIGVKQAWADAFIDGRTTFAMTEGQVAVWGQGNRSDYDLGRELPSQPLGLKSVLVRLTKRTGSCAILPRERIRCPIPVGSRRLGLLRDEPGEAHCSRSTGMGGPALVGASGPGFDMGRGCLVKAMFG